MNSFKTFFIKKSEKCLPLVEDMTAKGHTITFWDDRNVLCLDRYMGVIGYEK